MLKLYNTISRSLEEFKPQDPSLVSMYACGPTVYDYAHIGNYRKYIGDDLIRRVLIANDYPVKHVMNITDVGHLVSDADEGEDRMEKGARESGQTVWEVAKYYEEDFWKWAVILNIMPPSIVARATEHVGKMVKLIEVLVEKGFTYISDQAIYFDTSKFPSYTQLSKQDLSQKSTGSRAEVVVDKQKKNPSDFVLWFFTVGHYANHVMHWSSPWGEGFPGWHIECSAMSMEYLGETIDIHTGGIDHIPVHHPNEIAQSEAATDKKFVNYWIHHNFLRVNNEKMSKSKKNYLTPKDIVERGLDLLALRYLYLTAHYQDEINLTDQSLQASQTALSNLRELVRDWPEVSNQTTPSDFYQRFLTAANENINVPKALAIMWEMVKSDLAKEQKVVDLLAMDKILGLQLADYIGKELEIPSEVEQLVIKREHARARKDFTAADELRKELKKLGYEVEDSVGGQKIHKI